MPKQKTIGPEVISSAGTYDARFEKIVADIIADEKGYVDHPSDRGGPTKYGITMRFLSEAWGRVVTKEDIKSLTMNDARQAYHKVLWQRYGVHRLPTEIQHLMFEWMVMSGPGQPTKVLQHHVGAKVDGVLGPVTAAKVREKLAERGYDDFKVEFLNDIVRYLINITQEDPSQIVFLEGWFNRFCGYYK